MVNTIETAGHTTTNSTGRKTKRRNYSAFNGGRNIPLEKAKKELTEANNSLEEESSLLENTQKSIKEWEDQHLCTLEELKLFGIHCLSDAKNYYKNLFITGEYCKIRKVLRGARVFDPVYVFENKLSLLQIQELAKLCTDNLNFPEFTPGFVNHLKGECKFLLNL